MSGTEGLMVGALIGALLGAGGVYAAMGSRLKAALKRLGKYDHARAQLEQQNAQARKQIEQLQHDLADLRQELAHLSSPGGARMLKQSEAAASAEPLLGISSMFDADPSQADGFAQTQISLTGHKR